jgi:hypothetical protein
MTRGLGIPTGTLTFAILDMRMRRGLFVLVLLLAAILAVEPAVHTHPITSGTAEGDCVSAQTLIRCSLCATATTRVLFAPPELIAPVAISVAPVTLIARVAPQTVVIPLPARAPPAA